MFEEQVRHFGLTGKNLPEFKNDFLADELKEILAKESIKKIIGKILNFTFMVKAPSIANVKKLFI